MAPPRAEDARGRVCIGETRPRLAHAAARRASGGRGRSLPRLQRAALLRRRRRRRGTARRDGDEADRQRDEPRRQRLVPRVPPPLGGRPHPARPAAPVGRPRGPGRALGRPRAGSAPGLEIGQRGSPPAFFGHEREPRAGPPPDPERTDPVAVSPSRRRVKTNSNGGVDETHLRDLLAALKAAHAGDFNARLPEGQPGLAGDLATAFNKLADRRTGLTDEFTRVARASAAKAAWTSARSFRARVAPGRRPSTRSTA